MKPIILLFIIFSVVLNARVYTFSGGTNNVVQIVAAKILTKAYSRTEVKIKPVFMPLAESLDRSNKGETDGELARVRAITKLYPNLMPVPVVIGRVEAIAFSKNTSLDIKNWNDLDGHKFTIVKGSKFIEAATKKLQKDHVDSFEEAFAKLAKDETEIIVIPQKAAVRLILQKEYKDIKPVSSSLQTLSLYHFVHKKNAHLIPIITPVLLKMQKSGEIKYITNAYLRSITPR